ncbi:glycerol kinase GlpK [Paenibacillus tarimensis]
MTVEKFILSIDQSTSGTKALVVDRGGRVLARSSAEHRQWYPAPGWVGHDPVEIYDNVKKCGLGALREAGVSPGSITALTVTNQRETAVIWDRTTGEPVCNAIVWQCRRTADRCAGLKAAGHEETVKKKTGLLLDPYFSASKWEWMLEHAEGAREKLAEGSLLAGTMDSWLLWKLTGGKVHATDYTNASRTSLYNIHTLEWDQDLCGLFGVPSSLLPEVKPSDDIFGYTEQSDWLGVRVPITGVIGDSQAALFGNLCFEEGMAKATYGTGTSVLMNAGDKPPAADNGIIQAIAWGTNGKVTYALEAVVRSSGDSVKWIRDNLGLFADFGEMERLLEGITDNEGVYLVPAFVGLGAPYWQPDARAAIMGMNRATGRAHIIRAALESIAYQVRDAVDLLQSASGIELRELYADGGAADNGTLMQFQADMLNKRVIRSGIAELSAMGSVYLGGLAVGFWSSIDEICKLNTAAHRYYEPAIEPAMRERYYSGWKQAVASVMGGL